MLLLHRIYPAVIHHKCLLFSIKGDVAVNIVYDHRSSSQLNKLKLRGLRMNSHLIFIGSKLLTGKPYRRHAEGILLRGHVYTILFFFSLYTCALPITSFIVPFPDSDLSAGSYLRNSTHYAPCNGISSCYGAIDIVVYIIIILLFPSVVNIPRTKAYSKNKMLRLVKSH